jgi:hypothetical protein
MGQRSRLLPARSRPFLATPYPARRRGLGQGVQRGRYSSDDTEVLTE